MDVNLTLKDGTRLSLGELITKYEALKCTVEAEHNACLLANKVAEQAVGVLQADNKRLSTVIASVKLVTEGAIASIPSTTFFNFIKVNEGLKARLNTILGYVTQ